MDMLFRDSLTENIHLDLPSYNTVVCPLLRSYYACPLLRLWSVPYYACGLSPITLCPLLRFPLLRFPITLLCPVVCPLLRFSVPYYASPTDLLVRLPIRKF